MDKTKLRDFFINLQKKKIKVCIAESLTGGKVAYELIKFPGASKIIDFSIVCYSNDSKNKFFKAKKIISTYGVVSSQVAELMLNEVLKYSPSKNRLRLACTGYAGPFNNLDRSKIGLVYLGVAFHDKKILMKKKFKCKSRISTINKTVSELVSLGNKIINL